MAPWFKQIQLRGVVANGELTTDQPREMPLTSAYYIGIQTSGETQKVLDPVSWRS